MSASTWRKVENAIDAPYRRSTLIALFRSVGWDPASINATLAGGNPVELSSTPVEVLDIVMGREFLDRLERLEDSIAHLLALAEQARDEAVAREAAEERERRPRHPRTDETPQVS